MTASGVEPARRRPGIALVVLALVIGFAFLRDRPPPAASLDAPASEFSAARARAALTRIVGDQTPHPVGSEANALVRERIAAELTNLGLTVDQRAAFSCRGIVCAPVVNLVAEVPGADPEGPVVLLNSHYDSVHAGPGVADDLHGVVVGIEIARALLDGPPPAHPVRLLIADGEEVGLLGAAAHVDQHPDARRAGVVINVEAQGTSGLSNMFETSDGNRALVAAHLAVAPRPRATSLAREVYERMPNDTDLSVFKQAGFAGLNFAFVGEVGRYHTPLDDLDHLDDGSVQHQGDNVLATVRALANGPLPLPATEDAIYADLLGLMVVSWPASWASAVPLAQLVVLLGLCVLAVRQRRLRGLHASLGLLAVLGTLLLTIAGAFAVAWLVATAQGETVPAHAEPMPLRLCLWVLATGSAWLVAQGLGRVARPLELALGVWLSWAVMALVLAAIAPGASVALCVPVGMAIVGLGVALWRPEHESTGIVLASVGMAAVWATLALALEAVFGFAQVPVVAAPIAVAVTGILPALVASPGHARRPGLLLGVALVACIVTACVVPVFDAERPRRIALNHYDDRAVGDARLAVLAIDGLPATVRDAGSLSSKSSRVLPWTGRSLYQGPAIAGDDLPPTLAIVDGGAPGDPRRVRTRLRSRRGADRAIVLLPRAQVHGVWVEGRPTSTAADGRLLIFGLPPHGVVIDLELANGAAVEATVVDCTSGLPDAAQPVVEARDAARAVPVHWGDMSCIATRATL